MVGRILAGFATALLMVSAVAAQDRDGVVGDDSAAKPLDAQLMHKLMTCSSVFDVWGAHTTEWNQFDFTLYLLRSTNTAKAANALALDSHISAEQMSSAWEQYSANVATLDEATYAKALAACEADADVKRNGG